MYSEGNVQVQWRKCTVAPRTSTVERVYRGQDFFSIVRGHVCGPGLLLVFLAIARTASPYLNMSEGSYAWSWVMTLTLNEWYTGQLFKLVDWCPSNLVVAESDGYFEISHQNSLFSKYYKSITCIESLCSLQ